MKEKIKKLVVTNPFLSGIVVGIIFILLVIGVQKLLSGGSAGSFDEVEQIIREDYLRLAIRDNINDPDAARANWRFNQLGKDGSYLLELLKKDPLTDPMALLNFSSIVTISSAKSMETVSETVSSPTAIPKNESEKKSGGIPIIGMIFFILFGLIVLCLIFLYSISENGKKLWTKILNFRTKYDKEPTSWAIREDSNFDIGSIINRFPEETDLSSEENEISDFLDETDSMITAEFSNHRFKEITDDDEETETDVPENVVSNKELNIEDPETNDAEMDETDEMDETESENQSDDDDLAEINDDNEEEMEASDTIPIPDHPETDISTPEKNLNESPLLIHYQTVYKLGDDLFDETFSLDEQDDRFLGECGIGIAETINNTEPKAVTAFEMWLFDREDIHTPTHFLLSDFAYSNDEIVSRLKNKGGFDKISEGKEYLLESQSLQMTVKINAVEYGTESAEKNSYFTKVLFDVCVIKK
ncbi:hypothetical protein [Flexilinea flocculi]|uniref:Uncharacterized protein n=1 Tax=Flexilinea flocculi TaxID=1678840 RepID=A0A0S7BSH1_9CHLR|nr:hypothetical protein [Flexilinea flocculi]GAP40818.1 hypothetical protein ATC1_13799 [Flexilinea flocculi]